MKQCNKQKRHISSKLYLTCISSNNVRHPVTKTFTKGNYLFQLNVHFLMLLESFFIVRSACFGHHSVHHQEHYCSLRSHRFSVEDRSI
jgi:hypothetical protein